jgi:hypothetical protein
VYSDLAALAVDGSAPVRSYLALSLALSPRNHLHPNSYVAATAALKCDIGHPAGDLLSPQYLISTMATPCGASKRPSFNIMTNVTRAIPTTKR